MPKKPKPVEQQIDDLARAVKRGFDDTATKTQLQIMGDSMDLVRADVQDIKLTLGPLVRHVASTERRVNELEKRVERVERKIGLGR
jgi:hypothetical protein